MELHYAKNDAQSLVWIWEYHAPFIDEVFEVYIGFSLSSGNIGNNTASNLVEPRHNKACYWLVEGKQTLLLTSRVCLLSGFQPCWTQTQ